MNRAPKYAALLILPVSGGIGLVVYILAGISLRLTLLLAILMGTASALFVWRRFGQEERRAAKWRIWVGLGAGLAGTAAYDGLRYVIVKGLHYNTWPFDVFPIFGQLLIGPDASHATRWIVGTLFHVGCGAGFGVAYALMFCQPRIATGLLWAGVLELFMITLYPGWLGLKAMDELLTTSVLGHAAYGAALGTISRRLLVGEKGGFL